MTKHTIVAQKPVEFQWKSVGGGWVNGPDWADREAARNYAKSMANTIGEGYRELYDHPEPEDEGEGE